MLPRGYRNVRLGALIPLGLPEMKDAIRATIPASLPFPAAKLHGYRGPDWEDAEPVSAVRFKIDSS